MELFTLSSYQAIKLSSVVRPLFEKVKFLTDLTSLRTRCQDEALLVHLEGIEVAPGWMSGWRPKTRAGRASASITMVVETVEQREER
jgi:hypothetical protein